MVRFKLAHRWVAKRLEGLLSRASALRDGTSPRGRQLVGLNSLVPRSKGGSLAL